MIFPLVSLIIVVRNEKDYIVSSIESLLLQSYPHEKIDIVIVDGISTDGTKDLILKKQQELGPQSQNMIVLDNDKKTLATGWNIAIKHAAGEIVCRIDAHATISKNYVLQGVQELIRGKKNKVAVVGGWIKHFGTTSFAKIIAKLFSSKFVVGNSPFRRKPANPIITDTAVYGLYWKYIFDDVGYFDETLARNQDIDLHMRIQKSGRHFITHPDLEINYYVRSSIGKLLKKAFADGYWVIKSGKYFLRHVVPLFFVLYLFVLLASMMAMTLLGSYVFLIIGLPMMLYIAAASVVAMYHRSISVLVLAPMYHICYGFGSVVAYFGKYFACKKR